MESEDLPATSVYVDGSGGPNSGYGYFVKETGESHYKAEPGLTNNQAEYAAILAALERFAGSGSPVTIYSDSKVVVSQLNHEYAINSPALREMARKAWGMTASKNVEIRWISRRENLAGKMLGS